MNTVLSIVSLYLYSRENNTFRWLFRKRGCDREPGVVTVEIQVILSVPRTLSDSPISRHLLIEISGLISYT